MILHNYHYSNKKITMKICLLVKYTVLHNIQILYTLQNIILTIKKKN